MVKFHGLTSVIKLDKHTTLFYFMSSAIGQPKGDKRPPIGQLTGINALLLVSQQAENALLLVS